MITSKNETKALRLCFFIITVVIIVINVAIITIVAVVIFSISIGNETRANQLSSLQLQEKTDRLDQEDVNLRALLKETNNTLFVKV